MNSKCLSRRPRWVSFTGRQQKTKEGIHWRSVQDQQGIHWNSVQDQKGHSLEVSTRPGRTFTGGQYKTKKSIHWRSVQDEEGHFWGQYKNKCCIYWRSVQDQKGHLLEVSTRPRREFTGCQYKTKKDIHWR